VLSVPVTLPELEPALSRSRSRGAFASVDVECRDVSDALRPLARRRDFIEPCWLQSHLQSLSLSLPMSLDAVSRLELLPTDAVSRLEAPIELVSRLEVPVDDPIPVVADEEVLPVDGVALLSVVDFVSLVVVVVLPGVVLLLVLLLGFERSVPVCAITAGAARAMARTAVGASFIGILR
jgi:hypothetical protein